MLIDGHAVVHRSWHAIQNPLTVRRTGEEVRAVFGFANTFLKALTEWRPTHCAIAFDLPGPTFRHTQYKAYKAQRPATPPELRLQFDRVRQMMQAFNVPIYEVERYEADDVLGTLSRQAEEQGLDAIILTGDTDTLQLVSPRVRVALHYRIQDRMVYDVNAVRERFEGLEPHQQPDLKALQGDPSDNIPGAPGVGSKTAIKLIQQFGDIDGLYQHIDEVTPDRLRRALQENEERVRQGRELTTIVRDVPIELDPEVAFFGQYDRERVLELLRELEFTSLVSRVPQPAGELPASTPIEPVARVEEERSDYRAVTTLEELDRLVRELRSAGQFAFNVATTGTDPMAAELVGLSFSCQENEGYYIPVGHRNGLQLGLDQVLERVKALLEDPAIAKVAHNANYDMTVLANHGVHVSNVAFDTMVAAGLLGEKAVGLKAQAFSRLKVEMTPVTALIGTGRNQRSMAEVPVEEATPYASADADMTWRLRPGLEAELQQQEGLWRLFAELEMPLVPVLVRMQCHGVALDAPLLRDMSRDLGEQLQRLEQGVYEALGGRLFNINSPSQLGEILFKEMGLPGGKKTKTGGYSTDAAVLEGLRAREGLSPEQGAIVDSVLQYRELSKLKSTYVDALPGLINAKTGRLHTSYNQIGSATGRMSSSEPNLQNIPVRTELGRRVRKAFVAQDAPRWLLLAADYSQIELRVLAHLSQDDALLEAFQRDEDIHAATASSVYNVPLSGVTLDMRRIAKMMNFGVIYGLSAFGISQQTELTPEEGGKFIESYFGRYPDVRHYLDETKRKARDLGHVETLLGRRRYMPEMHVPNFQARHAAERMAVNMPVQGTAADIIKAAMIQLHDRLERQRMRTRMLLQVHDELIFEVPQEELEATRELVLEVMPRALEAHGVKFSVSLKVDVKTGYTWGDME